VASERADGWIWPATTKDGRINHDSLKVQHKKVLKMAKLRPSKSIRFGTHSSPAWERAAAMSQYRLSWSHRGWPGETSGGSLRLLRGSTAGGTQPDEYSKKCKHAGPHSDLLIEPTIRSMERLAKERVENG